MDVNKLNAIQPLATGKDKRDQQSRKDKDGEGEHAHPNPSGPSGARTDDAITVMGIPPHEMTPNVEKAINLLLEEVGSLRRQLASSRDHEAYLEQNADAHPFLPVLGRRGLTQRLGQIVTRAAHADVASCFLYLHILNAETVRTDLGLNAEEALLTLVADILNRELGNDAVIGSLGNADFGIILPAVGREEGDETIRRVVTTIEGASESWQGQTLTAKALYGLSVFGAGDAADTILADADGDLLDRVRRHAGRDL